MIDYAFWCLGLVGFSIFMYVVLDGFDLGVGVVFPYFTEKEQELALKSIAPMWDGNETWLVLGGSLLFSSFPEAYSTLLPAVYLPLMMMLCALVARGVAFEFRAKAEKTKRLWARSFFAASVIATFCQGMILGAYIQISHQGESISALGGLQWFSPFVLLCGAGLCFGYGLLGAGWLIAKTEGDMQEKAREIAINLYIAAFIILIGITVVTPMVNPAIAALWFSDAFIYLMPFPILSSGALFYAFIQTYRGSDYWPFYGAVFMFLGCFAGLAFSLYPNLLPNKSFRDLAAHESALRLTVSVSSVLLPLLISYSAYAYWVFRGKVRHEDKFYH